jgi:hypothetical protein
MKSDGVHIVKIRRGMDHSSDHRPFRGAKGMGSGFGINDLKAQVFYFLGFHEDLPFI